MNRALPVFCGTCAIATLLLVSCIQSGTAADKIRIATGGLAASSAAVWVALETKTFQKYGLEPEYIIIDNGTVAGQALLAGELQYLISTGALAITANQKGGDLTIIGGIINFIPFQLIGRPDIKTAEDLKGKKVAISRFGSASDFAAREALKKLRLDPTKDVAILQVGGQSARFAALTQNAVQAAVFNEPLSTLTVTKHKMNLLADLAKSGSTFSQHRLHRAARVPAGPSQPGGQFYESHPRRHAGDQGESSARHSCDTKISQDEQRRRGRHRV